MIFAFLFGLSMDYEVFILARMREEYDESGDTEEAVITGLGRTGQAGHVGGAHPVLRVRGPGLGTGHRHQGAGHRPGRRHPDRRHRRPGAAGARAGHPPRPVELVAAGLGSQGAARRAVAAGASVSRSTSPDGLWQRPSPLTNHRGTGLGADGPGRIPATGVARMNSIMSTRLSVAAVATVALSVAVPLVALSPPASGSPSPVVKKSSRTRPRASPARRACRTRTAGTARPGRPAS